MKKYMKNFCLFIIISLKFNYISSITWIGRLFAINLIWIFQIYFLLMPFITLFESFQQLYFIDFILYVEIWKLHCGRIFRDIHNSHYSNFSKKDFVSTFLFKFVCGLYTTYLLSSSLYKSLLERYFCLDYF